MDYICTECNDNPATDHTGLRYCQPCMGKKHKSWKERQGKEKMKELNRKYSYKALYGLTLEEGDAIKTECQACGTKERLVIDHCHKTNKVRGCLCHRCNLVLGKVHDDPIVLENIARYIRSKC